MKVANFFNKLFGSIAPNIDWKNIPTATYVRYILMIIATVNNIAIALGLSPINVSEDTVTFVVSIVLNIVIMVVNTYKDNPTSKEGTFAAVLRSELKQMSTKDAIRLMENIRLLLSNKNASVVISDQKSSESPEDVDENGLSGGNDQSPE